MRELVCFAAVLGFDRGSRLAIDTETEEIDGRIFESHQQSVDLVYLIALAQSRDAEILRDENFDKAIVIFEEFTNGGLAILGSWLSERADDENGNLALLAALKKYGYLATARPAADAAADVSF
jgi:dnd system-associated protein 4